MRDVVFLACLGVLAACDPVLSDDANAVITLTLEGGGPVYLEHSDGLSRVLLTPPLGRQIDLTFVYNDPALELRVRVDGSQHEEGERLELPHADVELSVDFHDGTFVLPTESAGALTLQVFEVDDDSGYAVVNLDLDARLVDESGRELTVVGYIEDSVGQ